MLALICWENYTYFTKTAAQKCPAKQEENKIKCGKIKTQHTLAAQ